MKESRKWKLKVGETVEAKLISKSGTVTGKVVKRDGKLMLSCDHVFYHEIAIEDIIDPSK
jgi:hypothetical protein